MTTRTQTGATPFDKAWSAPRTLPLVGAILAVSLASTVAACGGDPTQADDGDDARSQSVTGGRDESGYGATGFLRLYDNNGGISGPFCTAALIRSNVILTAAHCPEAPFISGYHVGFSLGSVDTTSYIPVLRFIANPLYPNKGYADGTDVAVGLLASNPSGVPLATFGDAKTGSGYRYVGYGVVNPGDINDIDQHKIPETQARKSTAMTIDTVNDLEVDAHGVGGGICPGDSGGPLYQEGTNTVVAVASGADKCEVGDHGLFASVEGNSAFLSQAIDELVPGAAGGPGSYQVAWSALSNLVGGSCNNDGRAMSPECASAYSRYCEKSATSGFGPTGKTTSYAQLTCINGAKMQAHFSDWRASIPSCDGSSGHVETSQCWSAVSRHCASLGYVSGFGPVEHSGDNLTLVCLPDSSAKKLQSTYTVLRQFHSVCDGSGERWGGDCSFAVNRYCQSIGANSGFGPVENSGDNVTIVCTY